MRTRCVNDTDGDGNCAACARNPDAPCRVPVVEDDPRREYLEKFATAPITRPEPTIRTHALDIFQEVRRDNETRAEAKERLFSEKVSEYVIDPNAVRSQVKPPTYDELVAMMERLSRSDYRDSWGNTPEDIRRDNLALHPLSHTPVSYHSRPKEFMQGEGGGLPYSTHNHWHFWMRYGAIHRPGIRVGVLRATPRLMAEYEAIKRAETDAIRLLSLDTLG